MCFTCHTRAKCIILHTTFKKFETRVKTQKCIRSNKFFRAINVAATLAMFNFSLAMKTYERDDRKR